MKIVTDKAIAVAIYFELNWTVTQHGQGCLLSPANDRLTWTEADETTLTALGNGPSEPIVCYSDSQFVLGIHYSEKTTATVLKRSNIIWCIYQWKTKVKKYIYRQSIKIYSQTFFKKIWVVKAQMIDCQV